MVEGGRGLKSGRSAWCNLGTVHMDTFIYGKLASQSFVDSRSERRKLTRVNLSLPLLQSNSQNDDESVCKIGEYRTGIGNHIVASVP